MSFLTMVGKIACIIIESLINSLWQGVLLVVITSFILFIFRKLNASTRYLVLWLTLLALAFMPFLNILSIIGKSTDIIPVYSDQEIVSEVQHLPFSLNQKSDLAFSDSKVVTDDKPKGNFISGLLYSKSINVHISEILSFFILGLWALITIFMLSRLLKSHFYTNRLKKNLFTLLPESEYLQKIIELLRSTYTKRKVAIYATSNVKMPMAIGMFNPVILIPDNLMNKLTEEQLKQVILHELAHIRRWDDWTNLIQKIIETFYFWHPMVLCLGRKLNLNREIACDDWVITLSGEPKSYAICLTKLIEFNVMSAQTTATGVAFHKKHIAKRIRMLLDKGRDTTSQFSRISILMTTCIIISAFVVFTKFSPVVSFVPQRDNPEPILQAENTSVFKHIAKLNTKIDQTNIIDQKLENNDDALIANKVDKQQSENDLSEILKDDKLIDESIATVQPTVALFKSTLNNESEEVVVKKIDEPTKDNIPNLLYVPDGKPEKASIKIYTQKDTPKPTGNKKNIRRTTAKVLKSIGRGTKSIVKGIGDFFGPIQ